MITSRLIVKVFEYIKHWDNHIQLHTKTRFSSLVHKCECDVWGSTRRDFYQNNCRILE